MDDILRVVPYGENVRAQVVEPAHVMRILETLERRLHHSALRWTDVSLLVLADCTSAAAVNAQHDSTEGIRAGLEQFCAERRWFPSLIGASVFGSFFQHEDEEQAEIDDGLLFVACCSAVIPKIPVAFEITKHAPERRYAGERALEKGIRGFRQRVEDSLGVDIPPLTVTESSIGLIFTTGSGHIESKEFIDFKDCYAVGQELLRAARECGAQLYGGCASNRTSAQLQCLYYSEEIGPVTHYRCTFRHGAVLAFLPYTRAQPHLRHPYRLVDADRLDIEFHPRDQYAEGRCFYVRRINGRAPIDFLADYWDYTPAELQQMADDHTAIPSKPRAHLVTLASSLNRFDDNAWPNVAIWLDKEGEGLAQEILLRLVRAEADDGNYYLMEMKPEYLADNARDLMAALSTNYSDEAMLVAFLCESRKYVLNDVGSNAEAEMMLAEAPQHGAVVGIYINGEYSTGAAASIGYHNYSQIGAIIPRRPVGGLPANIANARRVSPVEVFLCHTARDKSTVREFATVIEQSLPGAVRWIDEQQLLVGDDLRTAIQQAIGVDNQFFVPFISDRSVESEWVKREIRWAVEQERKSGRTLVLPVVLDDSGGDVLRRLRASWSKTLVRYVDSKLQLHVHDFTDSEITAKARLLADHIGEHAVRRPGSRGPYATLDPMP